MIRLARRSPANPIEAAIPAGRRIYAIGDVHGCTGLLASLLRRIELDQARRSTAKTRIVLLGDLIDRGDDSARLLETIGRHAMGKGLVILRGNHEASLLDALAGDHEAMDLWLAHGGDATLHSFGIADADIDLDDSGRMIALAREVVPKSVRRWLSRLPLSLHVGGYFFVHAGIRPGIALKRQSPDDLLWIREPFLGSDADHGAVIVHGHTTYDDGVRFLPNRIGVDTGAYRTGHLSALALEGTERWVVAT